MTIVWVLNSSSFQNRRSGAGGGFIMITLVCIGDLNQAVMHNAFVRILNILKYIILNNIKGFFFTGISASTAFHAIELGFRTVLIDDCSRGIDVKSIQAAYEKVRNGWGMVLHSREVNNTLVLLQKWDLLGEANGDG